MKPRFRCHRRGGFTLIEMIITLCVFLMLAGAIFSIFGATLEGTSTLQDDQNRSDSADALSAWLRESLLELPAQGTLLSYHREHQPFHVSGVIWGEGAQLRALDLQPQANGNYLLRYCVSPVSVQETGFAGLTGTGLDAQDLAKFQNLVMADDSSLNWRVIVRDLKAADWRFRQPSALVWDDVSSGKPLFAELTFQLAGKADPVVDDFWIPPVQLPDSGTAAPAVAAPATSP